MSFKEIKELRKAGQLEEALQMANGALQSDPYDIWNKRAAAWVYYDYLKKNCKPDSFDAFKENLLKIKALQLPEDEKMVFDSCAWQIGSVVFALYKEENVDFGKINDLFAIIKDFHFSKPSEAFSFIYKAFHKGYQNWNKYLEFADWWNFENFRSVDYLKEVFNNTTIISIAEQAYIAYSKKTLEPERTEINGFILPKSINTHRIKDFLPKLEALIEAHPEFLYPPYFKAKLLLVIGEKDNVLAAFLPFARSKRNEFWVWDVLADACSEEEQKLACLCKAMSLKTPDNFTIKIRQKLAGLLIKRQRYNEAKTEIIKFISVMESNKWNIPANVTDWTVQKWYKSAESSADNSSFYIQHTQTADEILFGDLPEILVVVEFVNSDKGILNFVRDENMHGFFKYKPLINKVHIGDVLKVRFIGESRENFYKVLTIKKVNEVVELPALKHFQGNIKIISSSGFGFVDDIFIASDLIKGNKIADDQLIEGKALLSYNKKKESWGWKAIQISDEIN
jgi:hypothetical protein